MKDDKVGAALATRPQASALPAPTLPHPAQIRGALHELSARGWIRASSDARHAAVDGMDAADAWEVATDPAPNAMDLSGGSAGRVEALGRRSLALDSSVSGADLLAVLKLALHGRARLSYKPGTARGADAWQRGGCGCTSCAATPWLQLPQDRRPMHGRRSWSCRVRTTPRRPRIAAIAASDGA